MSSSTHRRPTIALCVIARNEEEFIAGCLDSARPFVDELVVVDTGSTDRTVDLAREHGATVLHFAWRDDFAAARNFAIDNASADWILMLDADERLAPESGPLLKPAARRFPAGVSGYSLQIENRVSDDRTLAHYVVRLFPNRQELRFIGAIHEELKYLPNPTGQVILLPEVRIIHLGYAPDVYAARRKDERNLRMLEQELTTQPDSARILYYLVQQHCSQLRYAQALAYVDRFLQVRDQMPAHFTAEVYRMQLEALLGLQRDEEFERVALAAEATGELSAYAREMVATYHWRKGELREALRNLQLSLEPGAAQAHTGRPASTNWEVELQMAELHRLLGEWSSALRLLEATYHSLPAHRLSEIATIGTRLSLAAGQPLQAQQWAGRARQATGDDLHAHLELLELELTIPVLAPVEGPFAQVSAAIVTADWQAAYDAALKLAPHDTAAVARALRVASHLIAEQAPDAALDILERVLDARPREPQVNWLIMRALTDLGRYDDALNALTVLRALESEPQAKAA